MVSRCSFDRKPTSILKSALGQSRTPGDAIAISALHPIANLTQTSPHVRFVPKSDIGTCRQIWIFLKWNWQARRRQLERSICRLPLIRQLKMLQRGPFQAGRPKNWPTMFASLGRLAVAIFVSSSSALAAPSQLYGKTVSVSYTNMTSLRIAGSQGPFVPRNTPRFVTVYISSAGQTFLKRGKVGRGAGQVGNSGRTQSGGAISVSFTAKSMTFVAGFIGGATVISVEFNPTFDSCTANILHGKEGTKASYLFKDGARTFEIQSSVATNISCSVRAGNAFAD